MMGTARNGDVELHYDTFGSADDPTLLLVNGLGSQCINFAEAWCEMFAAAGYQVVRFDNRDVGLSSKLEGTSYTLLDMAADAVAVLDAVGSARAHVMGLSMGGMIVQRMAIHHADRLLSMTSVMSGSGEVGFGASTPEALAFLTAAPPTSREAAIDHHVAAIATYGSKPEWIDEADTRARAAAAYDRCFCPAGIGRQMRAVMSDTPRADRLREVTVPTLVLHGSRDTLIDASGGRRTAELIPGARYVEIDGLGHDYPPAVWDQWVAIWADFAASVPTAGS
jgi:pimeloyl-ACP methyl ester carboxylesterase